MTLKINCFVSLVVLVNIVAASQAEVEYSSKHHNSFFNRTSFPPKFLFGTASSAFQYEGAANEGGRAPSVWDVFTRNPGTIKDGSNGDVAIDSYHRYKEDVGMMKDMGLDAYRFSISWSRILPYGKLSKGVNKEGIKYYNNLINELLSKGLQPFVTLFHFDLPQALEEEYGGFLSPRIVEDFRDYAELCYKEFGDRVKHWITVNEPWTYAMFGYTLGHAAPGRCSSWINKNCVGGDSSKEPYLVSHHQLLAHAAAVKIYKQKYQASQKGKIGITLVAGWAVPLSKAKKDKAAAIRAVDFMYGWFMDPLTNGRYPHSMQSLVRKRLPKFTKEESVMVKGSFDFIGLNYYTSTYAADAPSSNSIPPSYLTDSQASLPTERNGVPIGPKAGSDWLYIYPKGFGDVLLYTHKRYNKPIIYITENGVSEINNSSLSLKEALHDNFRISYYLSHLLQVQSTIKHGVDVRGFFAWSFLDNFEWNTGYSIRFGINYVDYKNGLKRYPKLSATWFKNFLQK